ncbi:MAG: hypothetical protein HC912_10635 [Saprospiraceae bacterium]|nr:hypothetical protein [Saprospiraceae bacterium]
MSIFTPDYILIFSICLSAAIYGLFRIISDFKDDSNEDDDWRDGNKDDDNDPILDLPEGVVTMDEFEKERYTKQDTVEA